jgi:hypothetical protein
LNDSGSGSLRAALSASGPRTIVFRVSGLITNKSRLNVGNPLCTIAGQTAPGGGIVIGGANASGEALFISTHDVIARYLTYDGSNPNTPTGPDTGTVGFEMASGAVKNVILDHCSARWWGNKGLIIYANGQAISNVTMQNSLMYECNAAHPVGPMTDASSLAEDCLDLDFHHNMFVNIGHRLPLYNTAQGRWQSNIVFNWNYFGLLTQGKVAMDIIGNNYVIGNLNPGNSNPHPFGFSPVQSTDDTTQKNSGAPSIYLAGNISAPYQTNPSGDQTVMCARLNGEGTAELGPPPSNYYRTSPLPAPKYAITSTPVTSLDALLIPTVGNSQHLQADGTFASNRDSMDARIISQYQAKGPGNFFTGQFTAPSIPSGTPYPSAQHDGMSDVYKQKMGLDTSDPNLHNKISPAGITWLETFLAGITSF